MTDLTEYLVEVAGAAIRNEASALAQPGVRGITLELTLTGAGWGRAG